MFIHTCVSLIIGRDEVGDLKVKSQGVLIPGLLLHETSLLVVCHCMTHPVA